jgi:hypothetical protein
MGVLMTEGSVRAPRTLIVRRVFGVRGTYIRGFDVLGRAGAELRPATVSTAYLEAFGRALLVANPRSTIAEPRVLTM